MPLGEALEPLLQPLPLLPAGRAGRGEGGQRAEGDEPRLTVLGHRHDQAEAAVVALLDPARRLGEPPDGVRLDRGVRGGVPHGQEPQAGDAVVECERLAELLSEDRRQRPGAGGRGMVRSGRVVKF